MSLGPCLANLLASKTISQQRHDEMKAVYDRLLAQYEPRMGRAAAEAKATDMAMKAIPADFLHSKRQKLLQAQAQMSILDRARSQFDNGAHANGLLPGRALLASLVRDEKAGGIPNVEYRWRAIKQEALGQMYDLLARFRSDALGRLRNKSDLDMVVRELHGETTGDLNAGELAKAWTSTSEMLRRLFNEAGGRIGKLEGWALPHRHDPTRVGAVPAAQWVEAVASRLDRSKMLDRSTGEPMSDDALRTMLADVYETIVSDGWIDRAPGAMGGRSVANRHSDHRVLHFKSADDWIAYNDRFGQGSAFDAMMHHVERMSRDIATMQILGPNPAATIKWMGDIAEKEAATKGGLKDRANAVVDRYRIDAVWNEIQGQNRRIVGRNFALFGATLRNWQSATKLGSAALASVSDHATAALTRAYNGLSITGELTGYLGSLNPLDPRDREFARRAAIIGDEFAGRMAGQGRMHMEDAFGGRLAEGHGRLGEALSTANEVSRRLADGVLRASGLNAHTLAVREAIGMDFMATLAHHAPDGFDALPAPFRGFLERHGMNAADWDHIRSTQMTDYKGAQWIRPNDIADAAVRNRFMQGMLTEIDFAVPTGGLYTRALVNVAAPGSFWGELIRTGFQFKMFPVTIVAMHSQRMMAMSSLSNRALYAAAFLGSTTIMGALAYQLSELSKGKDPRPMAEGDFWWRAMLKGGGLGVFGDAIEFSRNEYGQDLGDILAGPSFSTAQTVINVGKAAAVSSVTEWVYADDPDAVEKAAKLRGKAVRDLLQREVPGSSLWYLRAAYNQALVDTVSGWAEGATVQDRYDRLMRRAEDAGQGYWAPPGAGLTGMRAPDLSTATAVPPQN